LYAYIQNGRVVYDGLRTHAFVCNVYKGVMVKPLVSYDY